MLKLLIRKLQNRNGAMNNIIVSLLMVIVGIGLVIGIMTWLGNITTKVKNDASFKISASHQEAVLIRAALHAAVAGLMEKNPYFEKYFENINHKLFDCDEFESETEKVDKLYKMWSLLNKKLGEIDVW